MIPGVEQSLNILLPSIWWLSASGVCECGISSKHYSLYIFAPKPRKTPRLSGSCFHNYLCKFTGIFVPAETNFDKFFPCCCKTFRKKVPKLWAPYQIPGFYTGNIMNFERTKFNSRRDNRLEAKEMCLNLERPKSCEQFERMKENVFWLTIGSVLKGQRSTTA